MKARSFWALVVLVALASCVGGKTLDATPPDDGSSGGSGTAGNSGSAGAGACTAGTTVCGGQCVSLQSDSANCGKCGTACPAGESCSVGLCSTCAQGGKMCGSACADIQNDPSNCGDCGNVCGASQTCNAGKCACGVGSACQKTCADLTSDNNNCGACLKLCATGSTCTASLCACNVGYTSCGTTCANTSTDNANCGACGTVCPAGQMCDGTGKCSTMCGAAAPTLCSGTCSDTMSDQLNCGMCGNPCKAGQTCNAGVCSCGAGQAFCGNACVDTTANDANCGGCGAPCTGGRSCSASMCSCAAGFIYCDTTASCVNLSTDTAHCGTSCANAVACTTGQTCTNGSCTGGGGAGGAGGMGGAGGAGAGGGGAGGTSGRPTTCPPATNVISDFEEAQVRTDKGAIVIQQQSRQGWWYSFDDMTGTTGPTANAAGPVLAAALTGDPTMAACNQYAFHATASGHSMWGAGAGVSFNQILPPPAAGQKTKNPFDVSAFSGISFKFKAASSTPVLVEFLQTETQLTPDGTGKNNSVDLYNTRSKLIATTDATRPDRPALSTSWQTVSIPFGTLSPRYLPGGCASGVICEAPIFNPKTALGMQFGTYSQFPNNTTPAYDIWVDDITLYTGDAGLGTYAQTAGAAHPFPVDSAMVGSCAKPTGATGKFLQDAYMRWKATYVVGAGDTSRCSSGTCRVVSPEIDGGATVSEGIGYGMLIAVFMNDKPLFDALWSYWQGKSGAGGLMNWKYNSGGGMTGSGSAVDADEDAAFALLKADKQWGGYTTAASNLVKGIYANDVDGATGTLFVGNSKQGGTSYTNLSYFAPAYYREFAKVDSGDNWSNVISTGYNYLCASQTQCLGGRSGANGLVPAWCSNSCASDGGGGYTDSTDYQYDSHRTPWRIGLDACWNGNKAAQAYATKVTNFFASKASAGGIDSLWDIYTTGGAQCPTGGCTETSQPNSMSLIGCAGVGAMAAGNANLMNSAWHFVLDASYTSDPMGQKAYTYYNATVGLLTALTMSGNFNNF